MIVLATGDPPFYRAMTIGTLFIHWSARIAFLLYAASLAAWLTGRARAGRLAWTFGLCFYLAHVVAAFQFRYHWSQSAAYEETARQTVELFGVRWGGGLYCNYVFTAVWALDVIWMWRSPESYLRRRRWVAACIHGFMAFLFFNAAVVFVSGWARWLGIAVTVALGALWLRARDQRELRPPSPARGHL